MKRLKLPTLLRFVCALIVSFVTCFINTNPVTAGNDCFSLDSCDSLAAIQSSDTTLSQAIRELHSPDQAMRMHAIDVLAELKDPRAVKFLINIIEYDQGEIRCKAAFALGEIRDPRAIDTLIRALNDDYWVLQDDAALALGKIKSRRAVPALVQKINDIDPTLKKEIAWALGEIKDPSSIDALISALADPDVHNEAALALMKIGDTSVEYLIEALHHRENHIKAWASQILAKLGARKSISPLVGLLSSKDEHVQHAASQALIKIQDPSSVALLIESLRNKQSLKPAVDTLVALDKMAIDQLINAMRDEELRNSASYILAKIGEKTFDPLRKVMPEGNTAINSSIVKIYATIGTPLVPRILAQLKNEDPVVRAGMVEALGIIKDSRAVEPLISLMNDPDHRVRAYSAQALGALGDPRAIPVLKRSLNDEYWAIRYKAAYALGQIKDPAVVQPLITALKDFDLRVQDEASWRLSQITGERLGRDYEAWKSWLQTNNHRTEY